MSAPLVKASADSASLWNNTLSPGWTAEEANILKLCLMKYGIGSVAILVRNGHLPGKLPGQINLQTQRLLGQQSLAEFMKIRLNTEVILKKNRAIQGATRKNGCIVNQGNKLTKEEKTERRAKNRLEFDIGDEAASQIVIPKLSVAPILDIEIKKDRAKFLKKKLRYMEELLAKKKGTDPKDIIYTYDEELMPIPEDPKSFKSTKKIPKPSTHSYPRTSKKIKTEEFSDSDSEDSVSMEALQEVNEEGNWVCCDQCETWRQVSDPLFEEIEQNPDGKWYCHDIGLRHANQRGNIQESSQKLDIDSDNDIDIPEGYDDDIEEAKAISLSLIESNTKNQNNLEIEDDKTKIEMINESKKRKAPLTEEEDEESIKRRKIE